MKSTLVPAAVPVVPNARIRLATRPAMNFMESPCVDAGSSSHRRPAAANGDRGSHLEDRSVVVPVVRTRTRVKIRAKSSGTGGISRAYPHGIPKMSRRWFPAVVMSLLLVWAGAMSMSAQNPVSISVDAQVNRHPINPNVYGVAHASTAALSDLNTPLNRNGGNNTTRYNWQLNADNRG